MNEEKEIKNLDPLKEEFEKVELGQDELKSRALDYSLSSVVITDPGGEIIYGNSAFYDLWELGSEEEVLGTPVLELAEKKENSRKSLMAALNQGEWRGEMELTRSDGTNVEVRVQASEIINGDEPAAHLFSFSDITEITDKARTIQRQAEQLVEASTPIIEVWNGVLAAPLIGQLDTERTQKFMERLLQEIVDTESEIALIDITGVPDVDTRTAQHLIETVESVKLLGAEAVLTGVSPSIAQSVVHLGIDLSEITTHSSLAKGLERVFKEETPWEIQN